MDLKKVKISIEGLLSAVSSQLLEKSSLEGRAQNSQDEYRAILFIRTYKKSEAVAIEIEDNGPGIQEEIKDKILKPFFTTQKGTAGTGLGLSITNDIIKAHGDNISVQSIPVELVCII